jgi:hypothetical protein
MESTVGKQVLFSQPTTPTALIGGGRSAWENANDSHGYLSTSIAFLCHLS